MTLLITVKKLINTCKLNSWSGSNVVVSKVVISTVIISKVIISIVVMSHRLGRKDLPRKNTQAYLEPLVKYNQNFFYNIGRDF